MRILSTTSGSKSARPKVGLGKWEANMVGGGYLWSEDNGGHGKLDLYYQKTDNIRKKKTDECLCF
jgi:hypothetical protein